MTMNEPELIHTCRPTGNATKTHAGIGMPAQIYLHEFGHLLSAAFDGEIAYQVGSSLQGAVWRDVDIRVMIPREKYAAMGFGDPTRSNENAKWCAYTMAFSELGRRMTGLPIDFQVQEMESANAQHSGPRSALIFGHIRRQNSNA